MHGLLDLGLATMAGFAAAFIGSIPAAGPISALIFQRALSQRTREATMLISGLSTAELLLASACALALAAMRDFLQEWMHVAEWFMVILLVAVAAYIWRQATVLPVATADPADPSPSTKRASGPFLFAFVASLINPSGIAAWSAFMAPLFASGWLRPVWQTALGFGIGAAAGTAAWFGLAVWLIHRHRDRIPAAWLAKITRALALLLLFLSLIVLIKILYL